MHAPFRGRLGETNLDFIMLMALLPEAGGSIF